ncbi:hypothetical protein BCV72DRAFT_307120 [Rhizopus microsporus var. microsporus]|uniref:SH3 domain-containing protein n=2 Tax=Rhizopus microsporus TaxID=58291 RepID=A0A2G4T897_RHIZD|nr:uncharacterized protein RHIMIDRAFT_232674 [Rhizopus microsporus ATCC 52813]ORE04658.1 hypothetical protein BCV72DRAFT_307120 [Rhizopus microsporus var. microsporus]PHZ17240.1 hypothetical protein RHIMIDRAFT_232674 [Rhizopus microsporus ATCC 52813]
MRLNVSHITKNPIVMVSAILAILGWLLMFIGACMIGGAGVFWWIVVYELLLLSGILFSIYKQVFHHYQLAFLVFLSVSIALLTQSVGSMLNRYYSGFQVAGVGSIFLIVMQFFWIILFGSTTDSAVFQYIYATHIPRTFDTAKESKLALAAVQEEEYISTPHPHPTPIMTGQAPVNIFATALHPYQANPEDPNELSFVKGETLEILNRTGNWWQARKSDGSIGIVPSNYFAP